MINNDSKSKINHINDGLTRYELGIIDQICIHCGAKFWIDEKDRNSSHISPKFAVCCTHGKVHLPPLMKPPPYLLNLYTSSEPDACSFHKNIRRYNSILACTSFGADINKQFQGQGVSNFQIHGQVYHLIGLLLSEEGQTPKFAQLYVYNTEHENDNRHDIIQELNEDILQNLQDMLDRYNLYIQNFRHVRDLI